MSSSSNTPSHDEERASTHTHELPPPASSLPLKQISLITLALQNSLLTLVMHYSRVSTPPYRTYSAATAVLLTEIFKAAISLAIAYSRIHPPTDAHESAVPLLRLRTLASEIFSSDCWKLSIPAILYVIQNNLQYVAASNLDAATFQVTYQMKILTTAAFSVLLLRKKLSPPQWLALFFLATGVAIVQLQATQPHLTPPRSSTIHHLRTADMNALKGFLAVSLACCTSGLAGVYFEMVLKNSQPGPDLWVRNVQLSLFSFLPALAAVIFNTFNSSTPPSLSSVFQNFGPWAWATVSVQVLGGLLTALVIKYSDNILKGFATSLSIVISFLASVALFDFALTFSFILGSLIVLVATWLYNQPQKRISILTFKNADSAFVWTPSRTTLPINYNVAHRSPLSPSSSSYLKRVASSTTSLTSPASALSLDEKASFLR